MDPSQASGHDRDNEKGEKKEKDKTIKRRNRLFIRYLERRKTDTIVDDESSKGDISIATLVRRSQSDKTEYSSKLKGNLVNYSHAGYYVFCPKQCFVNFVIFVVKL